MIGWGVSCRAIVGSDERQSTPRSVHRCRWDRPGATGAREIDAAYGGGSLSEGIAGVVAERKDSAPDLEALTALLTGALNEAALWIADADGQAAARRSMRRTLDTLLSRLFREP